MVYPEYWKQALFFGTLALVFKLGLNIIYLLIMQEERIIILRNGSSTAAVHLFGATLTSWMVDDEEVLFVSKKSLFDETKGIRGGVPVVFPQFGPWLIGPQHGFARTTKWKLKDEIREENSATFILEDTQQTRNLWNYKFRIDYTLTLVSRNKIKMDSVITNTGMNKFTFTFLLHTYFAVPDILSISIHGLQDCTYIDKTKPGEVFDEENRQEVTISKFTDRIYKNTTLMHRISNASGHRTVILEKFNLPDTVVWNPWSDNAKAMSDFDDEEYKKMICVEAGHVGTPVALDPKQSFVATQILTIE